MGNTSLLTIALVAMAAGMLGGALGMYGVRDFFEVSDHMKALAGDTRHQTVLKIRAQVEVMRQEYISKPGDQFAIDVLELLNKLEATLDRVEGQEFVLVEHR